MPLPLSFVSPLLAEESTLAPSPCHLCLVQGGGSNKFVGDEVCQLRYCWVCCVEVIPHGVDLPSFSMLGGVATLHFHHHTRSRVCGVLVGWFLFGLASCVVSFCFCPFVVFPFSYPRLCLVFSTLATVSLSEALHVLTPCATCFFVSAHGCFVHVVPWFGSVLLVSCRADGFLFCRTMDDDESARQQHRERSSS